MGSIPETPNTQQTRYLTYLSWRRAGESIDQLARKYELGSASALYHVLRQDGFPVCEVCGDYTREAAHCEQQKDGGKRRGRQGTGERVELPPAKVAMPLFEEVLDVLREAIEQLEGRKEYFQDGRFVVETHVEGQAYDGGELVEFKGAFAGGGQQNTGEFGADQHEAAWRLYRLQQQGLTKKDIEQKLRKHGFNRQDVAQLRKLGLLPPTL